MIAFASCVGTPETFLHRAVPGLRRAAEPDSPVAQVSTRTSILEAYNEVLDHFARAADLEALVLLHEDTEILDSGLCARVREVLADPSVAILGPVGARAVTSLAWWEAQMKGRVFERRGVIAHSWHEPDVDMVDGLLMVLSPWAVRELRFDAARYTGFHAYDVDYCFQARAAGRRVVVADIPVMHHTKGGYGDRAAWDRADEAFRLKWGLATAAGPSAGPGRAAPAPAAPAAA